MSCHINTSAGGNMIAICLPGLMSFTPEKQWIEDELRIFGRNNRTNTQYRRLERRLAELEQPSNKATEPGETK